MPDNSLEPIVFNIHKYNFDEWDTYDLLTYSDVSMALALELKKYKNFIFNQFSFSTLNCGNILFDRFIPQKAPFAEQYAQKIYEWLKPYTGSIAYDYQPINMKNPAIYPDALGGTLQTLYDPLLTPESFGTEKLDQALIDAYSCEDTYHLTIPPSRVVGDLTITYYTRNPIYNVADAIYDLAIISIPVDSQFQSIAIKLVDPLIGSMVISCDDSAVVDSIHSQLPQHLLYIYINIIINNINNNINNNYKRINKIVSKIYYSANAETSVNTVTGFEYIDRPETWHQIALYTAKNNYWNHQVIYPDLTIDRYKYFYLVGTAIERSDRLNRQVYNPGAAEKRRLNIREYESIYKQGKRDSNLPVFVDSNSSFNTLPLSVGSYSDSRFGSELTLFNGTKVKISQALQVLGYLRGTFGLPTYQVQFISYWFEEGTWFKYDARLTHAVRTTKNIFVEDTALSYELIYSNFQEQVRTPTAIPSLNNNWNPTLNEESTIIFYDPTFTGVIEYVYEIDPSNPKYRSALQPLGDDVIKPWIDKNYWYKKDTKGNDIYPANGHQIKEVLNDEWFYKSFQNSLGVRIKEVPDSIRLKEIHAALNANKFATDDEGNERIANLGYYVERIARTLGVSVNADGTVRSVRQRRKLDDGSTVPAGWNFGQFGLNSGGNNEGQIGGKTDERRDGIAYQQISNQLKPDTFDPEKSEISGGDIVLCENIPQLIQTILEDLDLALNLQEMAAGAIPAGDGSNRVMLYQGLGELVAELVYGQSRISGHTSRSLIASQVTQATVTEVLKGLGLPLGVQAFSAKLGEDDDDSNLARVPFAALEPGSPTITSQIGWVLQNLGLVLAGNVIYSEQEDDRRD